MDPNPGSHAMPDRCDVTVFGGTGDLALRKLLPALYHRDLEGQLPADYRILGVSRSDLDDASEVLAALETGCTELKLFPADASGGRAFLHAVVRQREVRRGRTSAALAA